MIFADEAWATAALDAPPMLALPTVTQAGNRINTNYRATADRAVSNVAFMMDPLRLGDVLEAYLDEDMTPIDPRPIMTTGIRGRFTRVVDQFRDRTGVPFNGSANGHAQIRNMLIAPDFMEGLWFNQHAAGQNPNWAHPNLGLAIVIGLSCEYAAANHMAMQGYRLMLGEIPELMTVGYTVFISGTFVIFVTNNFYADMQFVLNANPPV